MTPHPLRRAGPGWAVLALALAATLRAAAPEFSARLDGRPLELHSFRQGAFAVFDDSGPGDLEIRTSFDVRWVNVRPLAAGVRATVGADHKSVRLHTAGPTPLTVEFNDDLSYVVQLFAYDPEAHPPRPGDPGVRYFGPGVHAPGLITLGDGETLYLAPGAWVKGNVRSVGTRGVTIRGRGVLDGTDVHLNPQPRGSEPGGAGFHNLVYLRDTVGARLEGITLFNSASEWTVFMTGTTGTRVDGVKMLNPSPEYGDDGYDVVSSCDVRIENVFIRTNDDCVVVKNLRDVDTHGVWVRHAVLWNMAHGGNGLEVGFETRHQPVHDIHFRDIDLIHVERGAAISIHDGDAATVSDVTFDDLRVEDARRKLIDFAVIYAQYGYDKPATAAENTRRLDDGGTWDGLLSYTDAERPDRAAFRGHIRDVRVSNLRVVDGALPYSVVAGFDPEHGVDHVLIEGLQYLGRPLRNAADAKLVVDLARGVEVR